jgi:hypothetical protein
MLKYYREVRVEQKGALTAASSEGCLLQQGTDQPGTDQYPVMTAVHVDTVTEDAFFHSGMWGILRSAFEPPLHLRLLCSGARWTAVDVD